MLGQTQGGRLIPSLGSERRNRTEQPDQHRRPGHHRRNIPILFALLAAVGACGIPSPAPPRPTRGPEVIPPPLPGTLATAFILESAGIPPDDTTVIIPGGQRRVISVRRGPPDNSLFAVVIIADSTLSSLADVTAPPRRADTSLAVPPTDSVRISVRSLPGRYGVDLEIEGGQLASLVTVAMSYALDFVAPAGARERYGGDLGYEAALFLARLEPDGRVVYLPTSRPGSDLLAARVPGPGRYVVAAPQ